MAELMFVVEGKPVPARDCDWQLIAPCGCVVGLSVIERGTGVLADENAAMRAFWDTAGEYRQKQREGYTTRIGLRSRGVELFRLACPHRSGDTTQESAR